MTTARGRQIYPKTQGQKEYVQTINANVISVGIGPAGTGKTFLAMAVAAAALKRKEVSRIILTRPAVEAGEHLGFSPAISRTRWTLICGLCMMPCTIFWDKNST